jgi:hypothetical protein
MDHGADAIHKIVYTKVIQHNLGYRRIVATHQIENVWAVSAHSDTRTSGGLPILLSDFLGAAKGRLVRTVREPLECAGTGTFCELEFVRESLGRRRVYVKSYDRGCH